MKTVVDVYIIHIPAYISGLLYRYNMVIIFKHSSVGFFWRKDCKKTFNHIQSLLFYMHTCTNACTYIRTYTHTCTYIYTYCTYIHAYTYIYNTFNTLMSEVTMVMLLPLTMTWSPLRMWAASSWKEPLSSRANTCLNDLNNTSSSPGKAGKFQEV